MNQITFNSLQEQKGNFEISKFDDDVTCDESKISCNLFLMGQTVAGRNAFACYLFGKQNMTKAKQTPIVVDQIEFERLTFDICGVGISIVNTVESDGSTLQEQFNCVDKFLYDRNEKKKNAYKMIHMLCYCFNAEKQNQNLDEIKLAQDLCAKYSIPYAVILANADKISPSKLEDLIAKIRTKNIYSTCIPICSPTAIQNENPDNSSIAYFSREHAVSFFLKSVYESVGRYAAVDSLKKSIYAIEQLRDSIICDIEKLDVWKSIRSGEELGLGNEAFSKFGDFDIVSDEFKNFHKFLDSFNIAYVGKNLFDQTLEKMGNIDYEELFSSHPTMKTIDKIAEGEFSMKALFTGLKLIANIKGKLKGILTDVTSEVISMCNDEIDRLKGKTKFAITFKNFTPVEKLE